MDYYSESNVRFMRQKLAESAVDVLYVHGNHEGYDRKGRVPDMRVFYPEYEAFMGENPGFWVKDYGELMVVGVDDSDKKITEEQLRLLGEQLVRNIPVILMVHIPFYTDDIYEPLKKKWGENGTVYFSLDKDDCTALTAKFRDMIKNPDNSIAAVVAGHIHFSHEGDMAAFGAEKTGKTQYVSAPCFEKYMRKIIVSGE